MAIRSAFTAEWSPEPTMIAHAYFATLDQVQTMEEPMHEATEIAASEFEANFLAGGRPLPWAPLAERTIKQKAGRALTLKGIGTQAGIEAQVSIFGGGNILRDTDTLFEAAGSPDSWEVQGFGQVVEAAWFGPGYSRFHLTGAGLHGGGELPVRDWAYITPQGEEEIEQLFLDWAAQEW
jgi:hypothetical protein